MVKGVKYLTKTAGLFGLTVLLVIVWPRNALAATNNSPNGFQVSPVLSELTIPRGQSQSINISVVNPTKVTFNVQAIFDNFIPSSDESGSPELLIDPNTPQPHNDFRALVNAVPNFNLNPQQYKIIPVNIQVPQNASAGGYYGAIRFAPAKNSPSTSNLGFTATVGSLFLVTVPGNLTERLNLVQLSAAHQNGDPSWFFVSGKVAILTRLENVGDIHVQPFGNVIIKNMFGTIVDQFQFNNTQPRANVLPSSIRKFVNQLHYSHWFGRYTVEENVAYQQGSGNLITAKTSFWYFSQWYIIGFFAAIVILIVLGYWLHLKKSSPRK